MRDKKSIHVVQYGVHNYKYSPIEYFNKSIRASNYLKEKTVLNNIMVQHCPIWRSVLDIKLSFVEIDFLFNLC